MFSAPVDNLDKKYGILLAVCNEALNEVEAVLMMIDSPEKKEAMRVKLQALFVKLGQKLEGVGNEF